MAKTLQIVNTAYRCTVEEQDDPILWISLAMKGAGADVGVLLRGNAVNYAVRGQDASGLSFGGKAQVRPPRLEDEVQRLMDKGVEVHVVAEDLRERGIEGLLDGVKTVERAALPELLGAYQRVWSW
jgi:intracellular sulfur oxidation DsrE/DsrF family protein